MYALTSAWRAGRSPFRDGDDVLPDVYMLHAIQLFGEKVIPAVSGIGRTATVRS